MGTPKLAVGCVPGLNKYAAVICPLVDLTAKVSCTNRKVENRTLLQMSLAIEVGTTPSRTNCNF